MRKAFSPHGREFNPLLMYQIRIKNNCPPLLAEAWYRRDLAIKRQQEQYNKHRRSEQLLKEFSKWMAKK